MYEIICLITAKALHLLNNLQQVKAIYRKSNKLCADIVCTSKYNVIEMYSYLTYILTLY